MDFLFNKEFYVTQVENNIKDLKDRGDEYICLAQEQLETIANRKEVSDGEVLTDYEEVFQWIWLSMTNETEQREVDKLTENQVLYGAKVVSAIYDCATISL